MRNACLLGIPLLFVQLHAHSTENAILAASTSVVQVVTSNGFGSMGYGSAVAVGRYRFVTNCHVLRDARSIELVRGTERWTAQVDAGDAHKDLCILSAPGAEAKALPKGTTTQLKPGDSVYAIGYPNGGTLITNQGRVESLYRFDGARVIQTSAPWDPGASGGALIDAAGRLIGILTFKAPVGGAFHFAIPIDWMDSTHASHRSERKETNGTAFWERRPEERPHFLRALWHKSTQQWAALREVCERWAAVEPANDEHRHLMARALDQLGAHSGSRRGSSSGTTVQPTAYARDPAQRQPPPALE